MSKHKTKEEWIKLLKMHEMAFAISKEYLETINFQDSKVKYQFYQPPHSSIENRRYKFFNKYKKWKCLIICLWLKYKKRGKENPKEI